LFPLNRKFTTQWEKKLLALDDEQRAFSKNAKEEARKELEQFQEQHYKRMDATRSTNRADESAKLEQLEADLESDNAWERVGNLVDLSEVVSKEAKEKKSDTGRMRVILRQLKTEKLEDTRPHL
jgi:hypothetical protein